MNLSQFYNHVSRKTDTAGSQINVAETKRVLAVAFEEMAKMSAAEAADIVSKGLASGASKGKKKTARKKAAKKVSRKK